MKSPVVSAFLFFLLVLPAGLSAQQGLDLPSALRTAFDYNPKLKQAQAQIGISQGALREIRAALFPQLTGRARYDQVDKDLLEAFGGQSFGSDKNWNAELEISQSLYAGGKSMAALSRERLREQAVRLSYQAALSDVYLEVKERFFAALLARSQVAVQEQNVELLAAELASERLKLQAGSVSDFNVLRAEVALANAQTPLIRSRNNLRVALEELRGVLGPSPEVQRQGSFAALSLAGQLVLERYVVELEQSLQTAHAQRPELKRLRILVQAEDQGVKVARADYYPSLGAAASYGVEKDQFSDNFGDKLHGWRLGVSAQWSIFDSFATAGRVQQARGQSEVARYTLQQAELDLDVQVRRAYSALMEANELVLASQKVVTQADESLRLAKARFAAGAAVQLDVLDAQVALTQARTNEVQAIYDFNVAAARMQHALGEVGAEFSNAK